MKNFIKTIIIFLLVCVVVDYIIGFGMDKLLEHTKSQEIGKNNYIIRECTADILIFGSSRAKDHYDPKIIEDSLGLSCFNCGYSGYGSIFSRGLILSVLERYTPKMVIIDASTYDMYNAKDADPMREISVLPLFNDIECIDNYLEETLPLDVKMKQYSSAYLYNSKILTLINSIATPVDYGNGFQSMNKQAKYFRERVSLNKKYLVKQADSLRLNTFRRNLQDLKSYGVPIYVFVSPMHKRTQDYFCDPVRKICKEEDVPFTSYYAYTPITLNKKYFYDTHHMNSKGAATYTKMIIEKLRPLVKKNDAKN